MAMEKQFLFISIFSKEPLSFGIKIIIILTNLKWEMKKKPNGRWKIFEILYFSIKFKY